MSSGDPRTARTIARLRDAMRGSLARGGIDTVTVSSICREAGVRRTTFYTHYPSVDDLVIDVLTADLDAVAGPGDLPLTGLSIPEMAAALQETLVLVVRVVAAERDAFRAAFASPFGLRLRRDIEALFHRRLVDALAAWQAHGVADDVDAAVAVAFAAGGLATNIEAWARGDDQDPDRFAEELRRQMAPWWPRPEGWFWWSPASPPPARG